MLLPVFAQIQAGDFSCMEKAETLPTYWRPKLMTTSKNRKASPREKLSFLLLPSSPGQADEARCIALLFLVPVVLPHVSVVGVGAHASLIQNHTQQTVTEHLDRLGQGFPYCEAGTDNQ